MDHLIGISVPAHASVQEVCVAVERAVRALSVVSITMNDGTKANKDVIAGSLRYAVGLNDDAWRAPGRPTREQVIARCMVHAPVQIRFR